MSGPAPPLSAVLPEEGGRFSVGTLLSRGLSVWFSNLPLFLGISLVCYLPLIPFFRGYRDRALSGLLTDLGSVVKPVLSAIVSGILICGVVEQLRGKRATLRGSLRVVISSFWRIVGTSLGAGFMTILFFLLLIVPGIMKACSYFVAVPAAVVEGTGVSDSLARSSQLTEGYRWHIFGFYLLMMVVGMALGALLAPVLLGPRATLALFRLPGTIRVLAMVVVPNAILGSLSAVFSGVAYYQLRVVKEGIDIEQLAEVFD